MSEDLFGGFIGKKKADSNFLSLQDGESAKVLKLISVKFLTKAGYGGEEKEVMRLTCEIETPEGKRTKDFDNGTLKFAQELQSKKVTIGSGFTITRNGLQTKTRYIISDVTSPAV